MALGKQNGAHPCPTQCGALLVARLRCAKRADLSLRRTINNLSVLYLLASGHKAFLVATGQKAERTLDKTPVHHRALEEIQMLKKE